MTTAKRRPNAKTTRLDLGLALLSLVAQPGVPLDLRDIAPWCDCSWQAIHHIEKAALARMRRRLGSEQLEAFADFLFNERRAARRLAARNSSLVNAS